MSNPLQHNDQHWLDALARGNEEAFAQLYRHYYPAVFRQALSLVKTDAAAQDICNEVFLYIWQNRHRLPAIQSLKAYLLTAARNRSVNLLKQAIRTVQAREEIATHFPGTSLSSDESLLEKEYVAFIRQCVAELPARSKQVFTLCREEGFSYQDVAAQLGISRNAVKHHMVYAVRQLRTRLTKDLGISGLLVALLSQF